MKLLCIPCGDAPAPCCQLLTAAVAGPEIEVVTIEPAGIGHSDDERPYEMFADAVDDVVARIRRQAGDTPYAVYGCGTGSLIACQAACRLVAAGHRPPRHLFVSAGARRRGRCGQHGREREHVRPEHTFLSALAGAVCVPEEFLAVHDVDCRSHTRIRRDREWYSRCREADPASRLGCPVTVFTDDDEADAPEGDTVPWAAFTSGPVTRLPVPGGAHATGDDDRVSGVAERLRSVLLDAEPAEPAEPDAPGEPGAPDPPATALSAEMFREAMAHLASPVTVVTALGSSGEPRAFTASAVCSLSADPPMLLVCMNRTGSTHDVFATAGRFLVNVLTDEQTDVATAFARHERAEAEAGLVPLEAGVPGVPGASARFLCVRTDVLPGGDHSILVGRLENVTLTGAPPLVHYLRGWHRPAPVRRSPDPQSQLV